ncbi:hypothetical protein FXO37_01119 [Capsicum annuum]|nr:hypothetical protein FXO37_01119 [Capsicum annuum]
MTTVSARNNYEAGSVIVEAMSKVGMKGFVTLKEGKSVENSLCTVGGMQFDYGYVSRYDVTNSFGDFKSELVFRRNAPRFHVLIQRGLPQRIMYSEDVRDEGLKHRRAWASGLPSPQFPTFDPANTLSLPPKSQSQFSTMIDAPQHASESIPCQMHLNTSTTLSLAPQYKSTTFTTPHTVCAFVAQPSTNTSTLAVNPTIH